MPQRHSDATLARVLTEQGHPVDFVITKPRKPRNNEESLMQQAVIIWWRHQCALFNIPEMLLFSIPNGGWRSPISGAILKREGARPGAPDLMLAVASHGASGLFVELKTAKGIVSPAQKNFHAALMNQGYEVSVCRHFADACNAISKYLIQ